MNQYEPGPTVVGVDVGGLKKMELHRPGRPCERALAAEGLHTFATPSHKLYGDAVGGFIVIPHS